MDLTKPLDAINVATFIAYIVLVHAPRMRALFSDHEVDDAVKQYLASRTRPLPLAIARDMTKDVGVWKKEKVLKRDKGKKTAESDKNVQPEDPGAEEPEGQGSS